MPRYKATNVTAKMGLNFVRSVVEGAGSLFHKIEQDSDLGIDGFVEFVRDEQPMNKLVAVQIKSGQSYYDLKHNDCLLPVGRHLAYWLNYPVTVLGIIFIPAIQQASWVDIKQHLNANSALTKIRFSRTEVNRFDREHFVSVLTPLMLRETPLLSFERALTLFQSPRPDERSLGLASLFRGSPNKLETWSAMIDQFQTMPEDAIPPVLVYYLSHIAWHGDIAYRGDPISKETREYAQTRLNCFGKPDVVKLLGFIDRENMICRGALGQSVEAMISSLPDALPVLREIAEDESVPLFRRECAALIFAIHDSSASVPILERVCKAGSSYARELIKYIKEYGEVNPYG